MGSTIVQNLTDEEIMSSWVVKMIHNSNEELILEKDSLKKSLEQQQDWFEKLRDKYNKLDTNNKLLKQEKKFLEDKIKNFLWLDISILILSICVGFFTNLVTSDLNNKLYWFVLVIFILIYIWIFIFKSKK